jgi:hypothetical protein
MTATGEVAMNASGLEAYQIGRRYEVMPIPMVEEACVDVDAGPLRFVVEGRVLTDEAIIENAVAQGRQDKIEPLVGVHDSGMTVHVVDPATGVERLRFDCFENEPHYHYIRDDEQIVVRIDTFAEGDPKEWMLTRLTGRLPEMLEYAGAAALAEAVRAALDEVAAGVASVERLLASARR